MTIQDDEFYQDDVGFGPDLFSLRIYSKKANNLHFEGTYYFAIMSLLNHDAAKAIATADMNVDDNWETVLSSINPTHNLEHCVASSKVTSETIKIASQNHFISLLKTSCHAWKNSEKMNSYSDMGKALHTLQDSYSHTDELYVPIDISTHRSEMDKIRNNPVRAGLALRATNRVLTEYSRNDTVSCDCQCAHCARWDVFNLSWNCMHR